MNKEILKGILEEENINEDKEDQKDALIIRYFNKLATAYPNKADKAEALEFIIHSVWLNSNSQTSILFITAIRNAMDKNE